MGFYDDQIVPRLVDWICGSRVFGEERKKALEGVAGVVLEVGFGSGLNLPYYSEAVTKLVAIDPSSVGRDLGKDRIARAPFPVEHRALKGEDIPAEGATFDAAVSTFTLCTIPDPVRALANVRRALKPGGVLYFLEHGASPDPKIRRWQDRLNPIQNALGGGCNLNRDIERLVEDAGFSIDRLETYYAPATPKLAGHLFRGRARP